MPDPTHALKEQLATLRQTARYLLEQAAAHGSEVHLPPETRHRLDATRSNIQQCKDALRAQGVVVDDAQEDTATVVGAVGVRPGAGGVTLGSGNTVGTIISGDNVQGDNVQGDKHEHHHYNAPQPPDLNAARALLDRLPLEEIPPVQTLPTPHRMPLASNPLFVGRADDFRALAALLKAGGTAVIATGIGGMGKTQLAVEIAHRYGRYFAGGVFWISCADPAGVAAEVAACGEGMGLPLAGLDQEAQVRHVRAELETELPRLLILDNCEDEATLQTWKPKTGETRVLVTSRQAQWSATLQVQARPLGLLSLAESVELLQRHCGYLDEQDAQQIAEELDRLPLALHLAGSFLARYRTTTPAAYLAKLRSPDLLNHPSLQGRGVATMPTEREPNVARAFALSFERLNPHDTTDILARALLARAACLAPGEPFPHALLAATIKLEGDEEARELAVTDALKRLVGLGLLEQEDGDWLRLHRLLAAYTQRALMDSDALPAVEQAVNNAAFKANGTGLPATMLPLLPHLRYLMQKSGKREDGVMATLCNNLGFYLDTVGAYGDALPLYERALTMRERVLGRDHPLTALSLNNLAALHNTQGEYGHALPLYERALSIFERVLGSDHPTTASSLNNLAYLHRVQGEYGRALPLYERALSISERMLGPDHPTTVRSLNNLAELHRTQGEYGQALQLFKRALSISERVLGPDHPITALSLNNLAALHNTQGEYGHALPLYERALDIRERVLGPDHPDTAQSLNNLAVLHAKQGQYTTALPLLERAAQIRHARLGADHPDTQLAQQNLAELRRRIAAQG